MLQALLDLLAALGKLFTGIFFKKSIEPTPPPPPLPPPLPVPPPPLPPPPPPKPIPPPPPLPPPSPFTQSQWWHGFYKETQGYGCTDFNWEQHNPLHPECAFWHTGKDYALPMRTPIYAGYEIYVQQLDVPGYLGANALELCVGPGPTCDHAVWLYHMDEVVLQAHKVYPKGTLIGYSGTKGQSTGPHLHFEVRPWNAPYFHDIDPSAWIVGTAPEG
jgi:murein DD-endopeptidase MepM/ murein hydrolase activator NlpD